MVKGRQEKNSFMCGRGENTLGGKRKERVERQTQEGRGEVGWEKVQCKTELAP